jgi:hypothetical protein
MILLANPGVKEHFTDLNFRDALIVEWILRRPPEPKIQVRFLVGVF